MVGRHIGPYKVLREIGHGGMGVVYLAARDDREYKKRAAIKLVKRGMDTNSILRRFRNERQILADLDHPNIAKLLDGGTTEDGLSYFVMDYVEGLPIDLYCDTHKLPTAERLKLFRMVCSAVEYAHQQGAVHRDLKPSNVLVTAEGVPKLLDFGIAKLLNPELSSQTMEPTATLRPMTPEYASPEQARGQAITPASDIYSLGVLLYELLTGHRPYRIKNHTPQEIERVICEEEPEKPSTMISRIEEIIKPDGTNRVTITPESVSKTRDGQPSTLRRRLAGDIDNIVMTALRKEPERRYASVEQFSADIRRHLEGLPVTARKDTLWYCTAKFIKRNRAGALAVLAGMILALVAVGLYLLIGRSQINSIAVLPFVNVGANPDTEYLSDGITDSLINGLSQLPRLKVMSRNSVFRYKGNETDAQQAGNALGVRAVLTGKVTQRGNDLIVSAELVDVRDNSYLWGAQYNHKLSDLLAVQAELSRDISEKLRLRLSGADKQRLTKRYTENPEAYELYLKGLFFMNTLTNEGDRKSLEYFQRAIEKDANYGKAYAGLAESYAQIAYAVATSTIPPQQAFSKAKAAALKAVELDDTLAEAHTSLGKIAMLYEWDWNGAEREFKRAIALNPNYVNAHHWYSHYWMYLGRFEESLAEIQRALALDPLDVGMNFHLGFHYFNARQYDQAIAQLQKTLDIERNYGEAHVILGLVYEQQGRYNEAIAELQKNRELGGSDQRGSIGYVYAISGQRGEAQKLLAQLQEESKHKYVSPYHIAKIYEGLGEKDQAFAWLEKAYEERDSNIVNLKMDPEFDSLRSEPRFADLLRRVGLPQ